MVKSILERLTKLDAKAGGNPSKKTPKEFPQLMAKRIERELPEQSVLMPDGRYVAPNTCEFGINPADYARLQFVIKEVENQLGALTKEKLQDKKKFDSTGDFTVRIKADPKVAEGDIVCDFSSRLIVKSAAACKDESAGQVICHEARPLVNSEVIDNEGADLTVDSDEEKTELFVEGSSDEMKKNYPPRQVAKLVVINAGKSSAICEGESIAIPASKAEMIIGKSPRADVVIPYPFIGREQMRLIFQDDENVYVQNIGKTNPTYLNGKLLSGESIALLQKRDKLQVADFAMVVTEI